MTKVRISFLCLIQGYTLRHLKSDTTTHLLQLSGIHHGLFPHKHNLNRLSMSLLGACHGIQEQGGLTGLARLHTSQGETI